MITSSTHFPKIPEKFEEKNQIAGSLVSSHRRLHPTAHETKGGGTCVPVERVQVFFRQFWTCDINCFPSMYCRIAFGEKDGPRPPPPPPDLAGEEEGRALYH